jgi:phosphoenolpyruvate carboxylase
LFSTRTIELLETIQSVKTIDVEIMDIDVKNNISKHEFGVQNIANKIVGNRYEPKSSSGG